MDDALLARDEAVERVRSIRSRALEGLSTETVPLETIDGRVLAAPVDADRDLPPRSRATMDGFAFDAGDATDAAPLRVVGETFPEDDPPAIGEGEAVRIATGAPVPEGANAVVKREDATVSDGELAVPAIGPGTNVYERGSNVAAGERPFAAGERLAPKDAVLLRDLGVDEVAVRERFSTGLLATGTEIHEGRSADLDSAMLANLVRSWGHEPTDEGTVPDEFERVGDRIGALADEHDVVLTTGGTSLGRKDHVVRALEDLGEVRVRGMRVRPGKPVAVAECPDRDATVIAIPGKPVGAHVAALVVARPFFTGESALPTVPATITVDVAVDRDAFEYWVPVTLTGAAAGEDETLEGERDGGERKTGEREDDDRETGERNADDTEFEPPGREAIPLGHADSASPVYGDRFDPSVLSSTTRVTRADGVAIADRDLEAGETIRVVPYGAIA